MHNVALVDQILKPVVGGFDLTGHVCKLQPDDGVVYEFLAESAAFVSVLDGLFIADSGESNALNDYTNALMVEVGHNHWRSMLASKSI